MIHLQNVTIQSGPFVLSNLQLSVPTGAYAVLMGATGQGKTTILEAICGLRTVTTGQVFLADGDVTRRRPADRSVGYLPQDLALFPTLTVRGHLEFALRVRRRRPAAIRARVAELAAGLEIEHLLDRHVTHLSGGERQRVALGRALSFRPQVLLLDEPLNALDETTHNRLCDLLRTLQRSSELTTLHVTHNREEARRVADRLFTLDVGQIRECPLSELETPADVAKTIPKEVDA